MKDHQVHDDTQAWESLTGVARRARCVAAATHVSSRSIEPEPEDEIV